MSIFSRVCLIATVPLLALAACGDDSAATATTAATGTTVASATTTTQGAGTTTTAAPGGGGDDVVKDGDRVGVHYTGTLDNGEQFDSSIGRSPLAFVVGSGQVIVGFDDAVRGLRVGESRTLRIPPDRAYGEVDPTLILDFPIEQAPEGIAVGDEVALGNGVPAVVTAVTETTVTVDANHRLAGQALTFEVELVELGP